MSEPPPSEPAPSPGGNGQLEHQETLIAPTPGSATAAMTQPMFSQDDNTEAATPDANGTPATPAPDAVLETQETMVAPPSTSPPPPTPPANGSDWMDTIDEPETVEAIVPDTFDDESEQEEEIDPTTFADIFGEEFAAADFATRKAVTDAELKGLCRRTQNAVERMEDNLTYEEDLAEVFGDPAIARQLVEASTPHLPPGVEARPVEGTVRDLPDVHNVHLISAPDGERFNSHVKQNRFFPVCNTFLTTMPTIENYQCLHVPLLGAEADVHRKIQIVGGEQTMFHDRKPITAGLMGAGQTYAGAMYTPQNIIRWRKTGAGRLQSNSRLLRYDNGDAFLKVGTDYFVVEEQDAAQENQHLMGVHGKGLLVEYQKVRKRWRMRALRSAKGHPNSTIEEKARKQQEQTMPQAKHNTYVFIFFLLNFVKNSSSSAELSSFYS